MPKKGPKAAASGASKKAPGLSNDEDGSYIVFGNGTSDTKKKKKETAGSSTQGTSDAAPPADNTSNKPDTRQLIGGASWTGKLPVNMLSEHCQKQKWGKPEYTMVGVDSMLTAMCALSVVTEQDYSRVLLDGYTQT